MEVLPPMVQKPAAAVEVPMPEITVLLLQQVQPTILTLVMAAQLHQQVKIAGLIQLVPFSPKEETV